MLDLRTGGQVVERPAVAPSDQVATGEPLGERVRREQLDGDPLAVLPPPVLLVRMDRRRDVRGQRPRSRRPDHDVLSVSVEQREANEEGRVGAILVDTGLRELVLGERRAAARAPLGRAVAHVQPAALMDDREELPDVLDVRVAEGEVVAAPVHPLAEPLAAARQRCGRADDDVAAFPRELLEPVLLDLTLRVQAELALDPHLDPETLAVEPVLVALVEAAEALVALEHVLQRAAPRGVHAERGPVRRHRPVDEGPAFVAPISIAELREGLLALPDLQNLQLERMMIGFVRERREHAFDPSFREQTFPGRR